MRYPIQLGVTERGDIMLAQGGEEDKPEHVITISPDQVEEIVAALRVAVETLRSAK